MRVHAQLVEFRPIPGIHWSTHFGITTYAGEFDASSIERSAVGFGLSNSLTYQLSQAFGLGLGHTLALHPRIPDPSTRHNLQFFLIVQHPRQRVTPFFKLGASNTLGGVTAGFGPHLGFGLNIISSGTFSLFQETTFNMVFPGRAVDGSNLSGGFDSIGTVGVGIKITDLGGFFGTRSIGLEEIFTSAETSSYLVRPGEPVTFSSTAKDENNVEFTWDFGDGLSETGRSVEHIFEQTGLYNVTLSAQNAGVSELKNVFINVQNEAIAVQIGAADPDSPDLRSNDLRTLEGPIVEYREPVTDSSREDPIENAQETPIAQIDPVEEEETEGAPEEEVAVVLEPSDTRPKRTRVIILDGVRIEEEIPYDEIEEAPSSAEEIVTVKEIPVVVDPSDETPPTADEEPIVNESGEGVDSLAVTIPDTLLVEEPVGTTSSEELVGEQVENETEEEIVAAPAETQEEIDPDVPERTIIIVDGVPIEVETVAGGEVVRTVEPQETEIESNEASAPVDNTESTSEADINPIDLVRLDDGDFTWVLMVYDTKEKAEDTAGRIGHSTFVLEMHAEYEMFSIFQFQIQDKSEASKFLTTYGRFSSKEEAINGMDDIPVEFQARPFMMEVRR